MKKRSWNNKKKMYGKIVFISFETPIESEVEWNVDNKSYY